MALLILPLSVGFWVIFGGRVEAAHVWPKYSEEPCRTDNAIVILIVNDTQGTQIDVVPIKASKSVVADWQRAFDVNNGLLSCAHDQRSIGPRLGISGLYKDADPPLIAAGINIDADLEYFGWRISNVCNDYCCSYWVPISREIYISDASYPKARTMSGIELISREVKSRRREAPLLVAGPSQVDREPSNKYCGNSADHGGKNSGVVRNPTPNGSKTSQDNPLVGLGVILAMFGVGGYLLWRANHWVKS